jgi:HAD superfamily hydrolase (TIGR01509 family)
MIKTILFDMGGVLFEIDTNQAKRRFEALGVDSERYLDAYEQRGIFLDLESGAIGDDEFVSRLSEMVGHPVSKEEARHAWIGYVKEISLDRLNRINKLRPGYRTCLASNTNPFMMDFTESTEFSGDGHGISHYLDHLYCSYRMGVCKPSADFFNKILEAEGVKPEEILFVDDSKRNIEAAARLGINTLWVDADKDWLPELETKLSQLD